MNFLKYILWGITLIIISVFISFNLYKSDSKTPNSIKKSYSQKKIIIQNLASYSGITFYSGATKQIGVVNSYDFTNGYYSAGGFPPDDIGVCSDVIWRAFKTMSIDFKNLIDEDIKENLSAYKTNFDSNINFRRVKNINVFLSRKSKILTNELIPEDTKNLKYWQTGDIVIFDQLPSSKLWHIGIISDTRGNNGVPYMLDNHGYGDSIRITPLDWSTKIIGHYRYFN